MTAHLSVAHDNHLRLLVFFGLLATFIIRYSSPLPSPPHVLFPSLIYHFVVVARQIDEDLFGGLVFEVDLPPGRSDGRQE